MQRSSLVIAWDLLELLTGVKKAVEKEVAIKNPTLGNSCQCNQEEIPMANDTNYRQCSGLAAKLKTKYRSNAPNDEIDR